MKDKLIIHYDEEGDLLEVRSSILTSCYMEDIGDDIFRRTDKKTGELKGFTIINFKKRTEKSKTFDISLPAVLESSVMP